ncbi:MAG: DNA-directed RNA polymerase subunit A' [Candidatus Heimdallarchaeota archaeon]
MDSRLGTIEPGQRCRTCGNRVGECPGHFGHIELARPVLHVGHAKLAHKILQSICRDCSRILLPPEKLETFQETLTNFRDMRTEQFRSTTDEVLKNAKKLMECPHCGNPQFKIKFEKPTTIYEETEEGNYRLSPSEIRDRLERISNEDAILLGFDPRYARPEWIVLTVLPVPPVAVRPSIILETGVRSEDDLTHKLVDTIRINQRLRENIEAGAPQLIVEDLWELLQYHVTTFFDNEVSGIPPARHRSGRTLRTLAQRLKGKEGRFRGHLSGKRVDFSARTVISPDPNLSINEVGIPKEIARILTIPERVTEWNIESMKQLILIGPDGFPGANYIVRPDGRRIDLRYVADRSTVAEELATEFIVERHLRDGDIVLFNRQPSLHRMSIMAHLVHVMPYRTFRLNLQVTPPYNADFDGDEMNIHVPQSEEGRAEAKILLLVQNHIITPKYGGPIIGAIHDYISAAYLLTRAGTFLPREEVANLLVTGQYAGPLPPPAVTEPEPLWTGKQIFSLFLPPTLHFEARAKTCTKHSECLKENCPNEGYVLIENGQLRCGVIDKGTIGVEEPENLIQKLIVDHGIEAGRRFLDQLSIVLLKFLSIRGFSMGLNDVDVPPEIKLRIDSILDDNINKVEKLIEAYHRQELERLPGRTLEETLEMRVMQILSEARDRSGEIARQQLAPTNPIAVMVTTGARGNILNYTQMGVVIGQQSIRGERILRGYRDRTLPHFHREDLGATARGFVKSNYREGLNPIEFFFHAQGGREGLVDTAVRTSQSGYMQRRLINALQDLTVRYDGTVRNAINHIIQFKFGEDGVDPIRLHYKHIDFPKLIESIRVRLQQNKVKA